MLAARPCDWSWVNRRNYCVATPGHPRQESKVEERERDRKAEGASSEVFCDRGGVGSTVYSTEGAAGVGPMRWGGGGDVSKLRGEKMVAAATTTLKERWRWTVDGGGKCGKWKKNRYL